MKLLLILLALLFGVWVWRSRQNELSDRRPSPRPGPLPPQPMVRCQRCGLHLPQSDALPGKSGWYCCQAHRQTES